MRAALRVRAHVAQVLDVALRVRLGLVKVLGPFGLVRDVGPVQRLRGRALHQRILLQRTTLGLVDHAQRNVAHVDLVAPRQQIKLVHKLSCHRCIQPETETTRATLLDQRVQLLHQEGIVNLAGQLNVTQMSGTLGLQVTSFTGISPLHWPHPQIIKTSRNRGGLQLSEDFCFCYFDCRELSNLLRRQVEELHTSDGFWVAHLCVPRREFFFVTWIFEELPDLTLVYLENYGIRVRRMMMSAMRITAISGLYELDPSKPCVLRDFGKIQYFNKLNKQIVSVVMYSPYLEQYTDDSWMNTIELLRSSWMTKTCIARYG